MPKIFLAVVAFLFLMYVLGFLMTGGDLAIYKFWAPKQENAKRQVFENTQSYVEGKITYISRLRAQYTTAEEGPQKTALKQLIIDEASTVDNSKFPPDLQMFVQSLKGSQL
jgi:hypothetical protein